MRIGFALGNIGPIGTAENVVTIARRAEALGYDSLWTQERLLWAVNPQSTYPGTADGALPEEFKQALDPLCALTFAAAHTTRIALGTSVMDIPLHNPAMLARQVSTLDLLSGGRARLGLGLGFSKDEYDAVGAEMNGRGARADEFLQVLKAIWTSDPAEFKGRYYTLPKSHILPKPVQKPHPPIYLAAFAPASLNRVARLADGWNPGGLPLNVMKQMFDSLKQMAEDAGRDPAELELVVRANVEIDDKPRPATRAIFTGTLEQIGEDLEACRHLGANEVHFDPLLQPGAHSLNRWLESMEQLRDLNSAYAATRG
jgi:probable F420-dependent oxidoreductase